MATGDEFFDEQAAARRMGGRAVALLVHDGQEQRAWRSIVRRLGGRLVEPDDPEVDLIVWGGDLRTAGEAGWAVEPALAAASERGVEIVGQAALRRELNLGDAAAPVRRLYTPALLAQLAGVSLDVVRRWRRRGLIQPVREVLRLPYYDFQEVTTARQLARLLANGASPADIQRQLADLARWLPEVERPLAQLAVMVEGRRLLLRQGGGLIEPGGQWRFDFDAADSDAAEPVATHLLPWATPPAPAPEQPSPLAETLAAAAECEDAGRLDQAIDLYRVALALTGPNAELCFQLAEALYQAGDVAAARERYYMAVELDDDFLEARANLGCVLVETGRLELAVAAFEGALARHPEYADAHYHLARTLDQLQRRDEAAEHWRSFWRLAPDSPWAQEAADRLTAADDLT